MWAAFRPAGMEQPCACRFFKETLLSTTCKGAEQRALQACDVMLATVSYDEAHPEGPHFGDGKCLHAPMSSSAFTVHLMRVE